MRRILIIEFLHQMWIIYLMQVNEFKNALVYTAKYFTLTSHNIAFFKLHY